MKILATDLDRTLLPNGSWPEDKEAIPMFNRLTEEQGITVVYVTGRRLGLAEEAVQSYGIRYPDIFIGDVGATINHYDKASKTWSPEEGWNEHVMSICPRWDAEAIKELVADISGLTEQEPESQNTFKQSYYVNHENRDEILSEVNKRVEGKFDEAIIYSFDSGKNTGLLDFLPKAATKQTALEYVVQKYGENKENVVFCGDSGNDIFPLTAGFAGVMVRNADEQLVENVNKAQEENPALKIYHAKGDFKGLSGYYTSGVLEGAYHYGLLSEE